MDPIEIETNQNKQENQHPKWTKNIQPIVYKWKIDLVSYGKGKQIKTWMCVTKGIDLNKCWINVTTVARSFNWV